jgi:hypothetical protein
MRALWTAFRLIYFAIQAILAMEPRSEEEIDRFASGECGMVMPRVPRVVDSMKKG